MECLICYKVYFNYPESSPNDDFDISLTISKLFDISLSWFTEIDTFEPLSICPDCYEKLGQVHRMLKELDQIQINLKRIKTEVFEDLIKSEELSQKNGVEQKERAKIFQEICLRNKQNVDKSYSIHSDTGTGNLSHVQKLAPKSEFNENLEAILGLDLDYDHDNFESIVDDDLIQPGLNLKNLQIILEPLPIQYPFSEGDSFNVKDKEIENFIRKERSNIKMRKRLEKKKSKITPKLRKIRKLTHVKSRKTYKKRIYNGPVKHCDICNITFQGHKRYMAHHRKVHTLERPFQCHKCPKNFFSEKCLTAHLKSHGIGDGVFQCSICSKFWRNRKQLDRHMNGVHLQLKLWICDSCPKSFDSKQNLEEHIMTNHIGQKLKCPQTDCEKTFNTTSGLSLHIRNIHERAFKFFCPVENCGKGFLQESHLKGHNERTHLKIKNFFCDKCPDRSFYSKTRLKQHYLVNHADESEKEHRCKYCSKGFALKSRLQRHLKLHTGIRDQICNICGEAYAVKSSLDLHVAKHLSDSQNKTADTDNTITIQKKVDRRTRVPIIPNIPIEELNVMMPNGPS